MIVSKYTLSTLMKEIKRRKYRILNEFDLKIKDQETKFPILIVPGTKKPINYLDTYIILERLREAGYKIRNNNTYYYQRQTTRDLILELAHISKCTYFFPDQKEEEVESYRDELLRRLGEFIPE